MDALHERSCCLCAELLPGQRSGPSARRCSAQNLPRGLHKGKRYQLRFEPMKTVDGKDETIKGVTIFLELFMGGNSAMLIVPVK